MESARDSSPDASQASGADRVPLPARGWLRPSPAASPASPPSPGVTRHGPAIHSRPRRLPPWRRRRPAGIPKPAACHTFRHCLATHLLALGYDIRAVQELLGHKDIKATRISTHVLTRGGLGARSPVDVL